MAVRSIDIITGILVANLVSVLAQNSECLPGFTLHGYKCYKVSETQDTWAGALGFCRTVGGRLAKVDSQSIQSFLEGLIAAKYTATNITVKTGNDYVYHYIYDSGIDVSGQTSIAFNVMACNDAHVALSKDKGVDRANTYEIVLGGWADSQSVIRDCKQCAHMDTAAHQNHPVSCTSFRPFWISWTHNIIRVGKGNIIGKQIFLVWNDTAPHDVNYVGVATGWGAHGTWQFTKASYTPGLFWIGGTDLAVEGKWLWLPGAEELDYSNWATTEPDNANNKEHCAVIDLHRSYHWADDNCEEHRNFICETDLFI